jgi:hypothetical protein
MSGRNHGRPRHASRRAVPASDGREAFAALKSELRLERERRESIEQHVDQLEAQLAALAQAVETEHRPRPGGGAERAAAGTATTPTRLVEIPASRALGDRAYWLRRCEGFRVVSGSRFLGTVEALRFERHHDRPDSLILAGAGPRRRLSHVPVEAIAEITPAEDLIRLAVDPRSPRRDRYGAGVLRALVRLARRHPAPLATDDLERA